MGVQGFRETFPPQVATPCAIQSGDVTPVCGDVEARTCRGWGRLPDDSGTNRSLRFEIYIIVTNANNRVVIGDNIHSDNTFALTSTCRQISPGNPSKPWDVMRMLISCLAGTSATLRSHAAQAILRIYGGLAMNDMMNRDCLVRVLYGPPILRYQD